jgi:hypothetical protein
MARNGLFTAVVLALVAALALLLARSGERGAARAPADGPGEPALAREGDALLDVGRIERAEPEVPAERTPVASGVPAPAAERGAVVLTVLDPLRAPIAGARVQLQLDGDREERVTDALGTCTWDPPGAGQVNMLVERDGYAHRRLRNVSRSLTLVLHPATRLEGRVLDAVSGAVLADAVIEREHVGCGGCEPDRAVTDADGRYALAGLPAGAPDQPLTFLVRAAGHAGERIEFVLWQSAPRIERDFALQPRMELHGTIVDLVTGAPIAGARIVVGIDVLASDAEGRFSTVTTARLDAPAERRASPRHVSVRADGYCVLSAELAAVESPALLRLAPWASVSGRVLGTDGAPLPTLLAVSNAWDFSERDLDGTPYASLPAGWRASGATREARAGADGRFRIDGLLPWCDAYTLWVQSDGYPARELALSALAPGQVLELDVELERTQHGAISGELVFNGRATRGNVSWHAGPEFADGHSVEVTDGRYRLEPVPAGPVRLQAFPLGMSVDTLAPASRVELVLAPGQELRHDFRLDVPLSSIAGSVRYEDGVPAAKVDVLARAAVDSRSLTARTDRDGAYRLVVPAGAGAFSVTAKEGAVKRVRAGIVPGAAGVDFVLPRLGALLVRALDRETRAPVQPVGPSWRPAGRGEYEWFSLGTPDEQGFSLVRLPSGAVDLSLYAGHAGYAPGLHLDVPVRADGEPERVTFELQRGLEVRFALDPPARLPGWTVLAPAELWSSLTCTRNARGNNELSFGGLAPANGMEGVFQSKDGSCLVRGLAPGRYRFKVFHADLVLEPEELELFESPAEPIVVRWRRR